MKAVYIEDSKYDFDALVELAKEDPATFEAYKRAQIEECICNSSAEMQPRLRAQQSHIDRVVSRCSNPNHVNVTLYKELQVQLKKLQGALKTIHEPESSMVSQPVPNNLVSFRRH